MYIIDRLRVIYLAQPRTASRAVTTVLQDQFGAYSDVGYWPNHHWGTHHGCDLELLGKLRKDKRFVIVSAVRNPFDYLVSWFEHLKGNRTHDDFDRFVRRIETEPTTEGFFAPHKPLFWALQPLSDIIVKYENIEEALSELLQEPLKLPVVGATVRNGYCKYYTKKLRRYVEERYSSDLYLYGYKY
jgi:hypothetical protein